MGAYTAIEDYGLVGNLETCALVSNEGSIDWCPIPHLEPPSVFTRILDADKGGYFSIEPEATYESQQQYIDKTNVLRTEFTTGKGDLAITDFMPVIEDGEPSPDRRAIYRRIDCTDGVVDATVTFQPRFDYARAETSVEATPDGVRADGSDSSAFLSATPSFDVSDGTATTTVSLEAGETEWFIFGYGDTDPISADGGMVLLDETVEYWRNWAHTCNESRCVFGGPWHDLVVRSGLVLKLLTHHETGAIAAAPTASLPEDIGGVRNWDYRYNWIRDAAFTIQGLATLHHTDEAEAYFEWFLDLCKKSSPEQIQPLYGLHGDPDLEERELDHLSGYRDSAPVRIGNGAIHQRQIDTYGELILAIYETVRDGEVITADSWEQLRNIIDYAGSVWDERDAGIWEVRGGPKHFVFSKVMCWVALDRGIRIAQEQEFDAPLDRWKTIRDDIKTTVLERGYDDEGGAFVQSFDDDALDATALLFPMVGFLPFNDERVQSTIDTIMERLATDDGLVHRYDGDDGLPGDEGAFLWCSFWLVDALALSGRVEEARDVFLNVLDYVNPLGLLAEEVDLETGEQLGNFPQAFSHIGMINSALYLGASTEEDYHGPTPMGLEGTSDTGTEWPREQE